MQDLVKELSKILLKKEMMIVTAESCTGGLVANALTKESGASAYFDRGFVTYSNAAKNEALGVPMDTIENHGAVSAETAEAMALGALEHSNASVSVSITGIAGPGGGSDKKPVGTVFIGYAVKNANSGSIQHHFRGKRQSIQSQAAKAALENLIIILSDSV